MNKTRNSKLRCAQERKDFWMVCIESSPGTWTAVYSVAVLPKTRIQEIKEQALVIFKRPQGGKPAPSQSPQAQVKFSAPSISQVYPGCPYCGRKHYAECGGCKHYFCWDGESKDFMCPWCGTCSTISYTLESISGTQSNERRRSSQQLGSPQNAKALPPGTRATKKRLPDGPKS